MLRIKLQSLRVANEYSAWVCSEGENSTVVDICEALRTHLAMRHSTNVHKK